MVFFLRTEERKMTAPFKFKPYFWVQQLFCGWGDSSWIQMKELKYTSRLKWLIIPNLVWSCPLVFFLMLTSACQLASSKQNPQAKPYVLANRRTTWLPTEWKNVLSVSLVPLKWCRISLFRKDGYFFSACVVSGASGNLWTLFWNLFYFIYFILIFLISTDFLKKIMIIESYTTIPKESGQGKGKVETKKLN